MMSRPEAGAPRLQSNYLKRSIAGRLKPFTFGTLTLCGTNIFDVLAPLALKAAIDAISANDRIGLIRASLVFLALTFVTAVLRHQWRVHFGRFHHGVAHDYRVRLYRHFLRVGQKFFDRNPVGSLMSLMIQDINTIRMGVGSGLILLIDGLTLFALIIPIMFWLSSAWTFQVLLLLPLVPFIMKWMETKILLASEAYQAQSAKLASVGQENVYGIRVTKAFATEDARLSLFESSSRENATIATRLFTLDAAFEPLMQVPMVAGAVLLLFVGAHDVMSGVVGLGTFVAYYQYVRRMVWPMAAIGLAFSQIQQGESSDRRIQDVLDERPEVTTCDPGQVITQFEKLELKNLSYTYPQSCEAALKDLSLEIRKSEIIGLTGPVGAGKSTLIQLIAGLRQPPPRSLFLNGVAFEDSNLESWQKQIHLVTQDPFLFSWSIHENLTAAQQGWSEPSRAQLDLKPILRVSQLEHEIETMPLGLETQLGERGINLSGGQRQRLTFARTLFRIMQPQSNDSGLLILDDSLSAVDSVTETAVLSALDELVKQNGLTAVLISHRPKALAFCHRVYTLNSGMLVRTQSQKSEVQGV